MKILKNINEVQDLIEKGRELAFAIEHYPSRGQTSVQKLYETRKGKLFLKKVSDRNHQECQIDTSSATLAEREFWAYQLAEILGLNVPQMVLLDSMTTVQVWLDFPDAHHFITDQGPLDLEVGNVFECACFDWLTGQVDRHDANYLYDFVNKKIILVDSAFAFLRYDGSLPHYLQIFEVLSPESLSLKQESSVLKKIISLGETLQKLAPLRSSAEQEAFKRRIQQMFHIQSVRDVMDLYRKSK